MLLLDTNPLNDAPSDDIEPQTNKSPEAYPPWPFNHVFIVDGL